MMLLILISVLGYELKTAIGTSVFIMTFTALTGAVSHFAIGGMPDLTVLVLCVVFTLLWARIAREICQQGLRQNTEPGYRHCAGHSRPCNFLVLPAQLTFSISFLGGSIYEHNSGSPPPAVWWKVFRKMA